MNQRKKQQIKNSPKGSIRIIAGKHRGRKLPVLMAAGLRPTTDRVKETVFNWLMPYIQQSNCLDCFAGSGGLGFEALSRGAQQLTFLEFNKAAAQQLKQNQALLNLCNATIVHTDALSYLKTFSEKKRQPFDVVFLDPPFRKQFIEQTALLLNQGWLANNALIYVEMEVDNNNQQLPENWQMLKEKVAGQVVYRLYQLKDKS
ncbi:MAG: 16S rRNA (guanine(966)-N(2))-methyltransferase RsmD [Alteromonadaceae bacterium]|nr:16S rRNA (guanine(966)-N(2))-methyltransferase RsmD [Alteromonadaceae bacterium]